MTAQIMEISELKSEPDSELVIRFQTNRDAQAFSELYNRYYPRILQYSQHLLKNHEEALDVAQDVFLRAMEKLTSLKNPITFPAWLFSISRNICIDRCKLLATLRTEPEDCILLTLNASENSWEEEYMEKEQQITRVFELLGNLSAESREILEMKYLENYSIEQIQAHFHMGESAVKMRLARARNRVCMLYEKEAQRAM
jgi:RNA polymerase sigma-70 factor (ECF subfamily)